MKAWAVHTVFAAVLVGSLAGRERPAGTPVVGAGLDSVVLSVAQSRGLTFREYRAGGTDDARTLVFDAPGCSRPVLATWRLATFEDEATVESAPEQRYQKQYVYIDQKWNSPDPWAVSVQRMKYSLLAMFGLTEYAPSAFALQVETPKDCQAGLSIDWAPAWSRSYLAPAGTTAQGK